MPNVLIAGLPSDLERWIVQRFEGTAGLVIRTAHSGEETLVQLAQDDYALLILDDSLKQPPAEEVLARSRHEMGLRRMKAIYCLEPARLANLSRDFAKHLQSDDQMLFHPLQQEKLIQDVLWTVRPRAASAASQEAAAEDDLSDLSGEVWSQFQGQIFDQVATIEEAGCALLDGSLTLELCEKARREAHKLAGSLGSLGFEKGTRLAREIEQILQARSAIGKPECLRVCDAVFELRELLERGPGTSPDQETGPQEPAARQKTARENPLLLVVDGDQELGRSLAIEAPHFGLRVEAVTTLEAARDLTSREAPSAVLLDPRLAEGSDTGEFASGLAARFPSVPILALTEISSLAARLTYVHLGARAFLEKPLPVSQVLDTVVQLLQCEEKSATRVLVLDHDPVVLASVAQWLEPASLAVRTFDGPLQFWDALQGPSPHVLVMDADMPRLGGVDLCRVLRNDPRWNATPVVITTAYGDPETAQRVFAAGADDLLVKPMAGPELLARISARLDRTRDLVVFPERDSLSGLESFRSSLRVLDWLVRLSRRQKEPLCLVALGLDDVEGICERSDQSAVNQLYARLGRVLLSAFRSGDVVSRWRDDEFLVALYGMTRSDGVQRIADFLETMRIEESAAVFGPKLRASFSAGVAQSPPDGSDLRSLYRAAAQAMQEAKSRGGDRVIPAGGCAGEPSREPDVVLVDDDETLTGLLRHTLETRGYRTESFSDGKAALEKLGGPQPLLRPHVLLLDVDLPSMDGLTVLRRLAEDGAVKKTRVIMLTARSSEAEIVSALENGAFDHVAKPFSLRVLVQRVRRAMEV